MALQWTPTLLHRTLNTAPKIWTISIHHRTNSHVFHIFPCWTLKVQILLLQIWFLGSPLHHHVLQVYHSAAHVPGQRLHNTFLQQDLARSAPPCLTSSEHLSHSSSSSVYGLSFCSQVTAAPFSSHAVSVTSGAVPSSFVQLPVQLLICDSALNNQNKWFSTNELFEQWQFSECTVILGLLGHTFHAANTSAALFHSYDWHISELFHVCTQPIDCFSSTFGAAATLDYWVTPQHSVTMHSLAFPVPPGDAAVPRNTLAFPLQQQQSDAATTETNAQVLCSTPSPSPGCLLKLSPFSFDASTT